MASLIQYGVEEHGDSGFAFAGSTLNNIWPRRFWPPVDVSDHTFENPAYTGEHVDGFGNKITVFAASNPYQRDMEPKIITQRATGYGLVNFNKSDRAIKTECWPRSVAPTLENQYPGWPVIISQEDNYGRKAKAWLPQIEVDGAEKPVISVWDKNDELVYSIRMKSKTFRPKVFADGKYKIGLLNPKNDKRMILNDIKAKKQNDKVIKVKLD